MKTFWSREENRQNQPMLTWSVEIEPGIHCRKTSFSALQATSTDKDYIGPQTLLKKKENCFFVPSLPLRDLS